MGLVSVTVDKFSYELECDDGEEERLIRLARDLNTRIEKLRSKLVRTADDRLTVILMLTLMDELWDSQDRLKALEANQNNRNVTPIGASVFQDCQNDAEQPGDDETDALVDEIKEAG